MPLGLGTLLQPFGQPQVRSVVCDGEQCWAAPGILGQLLPITTAPSCSPGTTQPKVWGLPKSLGWVTFPQYCCPSRAPSHSHGTQTHSP